MSFRSFAGISLNREGLTRIVVLTPRHAIKVPNFLGLRARDSAWSLFLHGLLENIREARASRLNHLVANRLCPIVFAMPGGWLNVMKRAEPIDAETFATLDYTDFVRNGEHWIAVENKQSSFARLNGHIVAIDYNGVIEQALWQKLFLNSEIRQYAKLAEEQPDQASLQDSADKATTGSHA